MKKEYFIGDRRKYGVTLMETVKKICNAHKEVWKIANKNGNEQ